MDEATKSAWKEFLNGPGGADLMARLISNETMYMAEGTKDKTVDGKALAMAKFEAIYKFRTGIQSIATPSKTD